MDLEYVILNQVQLKNPKQNKININIYIYKKLAKLNIEVIQIVYCIYNLGCQWRILTRMMTSYSLNKLVLS